MINKVTMSPKLKIFFGISVLLFIIHGLEEILTGFYNTDSQVAFWFGNLNSLPTPQATFLIFQIMWWLILIVSFLLISGEKWQSRFMVVVPGLIYLYELHHLYKAIGVGGYYPGIVTAIPLYVIGFFFWKELLKNWRENYGK